MRYKNEIIILLSIIFLIGSYIFKQNSSKASFEMMQNNKKDLMEVQKVISLEHIWSTKKLSSNLNSLKNIVDKEKIQWHKNGKKLFVKFIDINSDELNKILNKVLNTAIQIEEISIDRNNDNYIMELKCKW